MTTPEMPTKPSDSDYLDLLPDDVEMSLFDHLEELRQRFFYALIAVAIAVIVVLVLFGLII